MKILRFIGPTRRVGTLGVILTATLVFCINSYWDSRDVTAEGEQKLIKLDHRKVFRLFNKMGKFGTTRATLHFLLARESDSFATAVLTAMNLRLESATTKASGVKKLPAMNTRSYSTIPVADVHLVLIACGSRIQQAITMLRSAVMMSQDIKVNVIVFLDNEFAHEFATSILKLKWTMNSIGIDFRFELQRIWFPAYKNEIWRNMWQPCATQRLFFPKLLPTYDSVLFVDSDVLFLSNVSDYWAHFVKMDHLQFTSVVANDELPGNGWYNLHSEVAAFGPRGLNAGIMLMNLTRMRQFKFVEKCIKIYEKFEDEIFLADQDILNILYNNHPELALQIPCSFNFRASHCDCGHDSFAREDCKCAAAMSDGVSLMHGNLGAFHYADYPFMRDTYAAFQKWDVVNMSCFDFVRTLKQIYEEESSEANPCFGLTADMLFGKMDIYCKRIAYSKQSL